MSDDPLDALKKRVAHRDAVLIDVQRRLQDICDAVFDIEREHADRKRERAHYTGRTDDVDLRKRDERLNSVAAVAHARLHRLTLEYDRRYAEYLEAKAVLERAVFVADLAAMRFCAS